MRIVTERSKSFWRWSAILGAPFVIAAGVVLYDLGARPLAVQASPIIRTGDDAPAADTVSTTPTAAEPAEISAVAQELSAPAVEELALEDSSDEADPELREEADALLGLLREEAAQ